MVQTRRNFIRTCSAVSLGFMGLNVFTQCKPTVPKGENNGGYGPLLNDPDGLIKLPKGFNYKIISKVGTKMADGFLVPGKPDGMATFQGKNDTVIIVRNHELTSASEGAFGPKNELLKKLKPNQLYDYGKGKTPGYGGTTTLIYNQTSGLVEQEFLSLAGTIRNCAGGKTPWNSWITCEETVLPKHKFWEKNHGYNFEVPATDTPWLTEPIPLTGMGRFNHEAVCVDPKTSIVYQTEDRQDGLIYRYIPDTPGKLAEGGKLQALAIRGQKSKDLRNWDATTAFEEKSTFEVEWIDMKDVESRKDDLRLRGFKQGAAKFSRGEGMWFGKGEFYFACTDGGRTKTGQVFRYIPSQFEGTNQEAEAPATLELFAEPNNRKLLQYCDNLTVAPWGDIVLAEDHGHPFLVGINPKGEYFKIAENVGYQSEFAGVTFSPDGSTLFVNVQHAGLTMAITGPWVGREILKDS